MTGAIEFLQKAKAICKGRIMCGDCPAKDICKGINENISEADLVRKVMDYQIKEASHD